MAIEPQVALEIARFLVVRPTPEQIVAFHPSAEATDRFYALIDAEEIGTITDEERAELDSCISVEHIDAAHQGRSASCIATKRHSSLDTR
jgi:hypothetical protein